MTQVHDGLVVSIFTADQEIEGSNPYQNRNFFWGPAPLAPPIPPNYKEYNEGCGGSVVGSVLCIRRVTGSNPTLAAT